MRIEGKIEFNFFLERKNHWNESSFILYLYIEDINEECRDDKVEMCRYIFVFFKELGNASF